MRYRKLRRLLSGMDGIKTERLTIKDLSPSDAPALNAYASLPIVSEYLLWSPHLNLAETEGYIEFLCKRYRKGLYADWGVFITESNTLIGTCGYSHIDPDAQECEIGYVMSPEYWGHGYMSEAVDSVLSLTFREIGASCAKLRIMKENVRSEALAKRLGFRLDYVCEDEITVKGLKRTLLHYVMTREEYSALHPESC